MATYSVYDKEGKLVGEGWSKPTAESIAQSYGGRTVKVTILEQFWKDAGPAIIFVGILAVIQEIVYLMFGI